MPSSQTALAAIATIVAVLFATVLLERWVARRRPHELVWAVSLGMFALASAALWVGLSSGWTMASFRVFYLFGAILNVPWLALGTVYLLAGERAGRRWTQVVAALSAFAAGVMVVAATKAPIGANELPQGKELFGVWPRALAATASGVGAMVVIVGAVSSAWRAARGTLGRVVARPGRLAAGNLVIAVGTVILGFSGTLQGRLGKAEAFALTLAVGVVVLFTGFAIATSASTSAAPQRVRRIDLSDLYAL